MRVCVVDANDVKLNRKDDEGEGHDAQATKKG